MLNTYVLYITVRSIRYHFTMQGWEGQDGNGSGRGKLSLARRVAKDKMLFRVGR